jgi:hypothetical protein
MRAASGAEMAFMNSGAIRADLVAKHEGASGLRRDLHGPARRSAVRRHPRTRPTTSS